MHRLSSTKSEDQRQIPAAFDGGSVIGGDGLLHVRFEGRILPHATGRRKYSVHLFCDTRWTIRISDDAFRIVSRQFSNDTSEQHFGNCLFKMWY